ncbi:MAG: zinc-dependent metalloprotease [Pirellulaceae bacterium]|nr:zinc-dependent metalloprotease [Planctomycetales bacterium]
MNCIRVIKYALILLFLGAAAMTGAGRTIAQEAATGGPTTQEDQVAGAQPAGTAVIAEGDEGDDEETDGGGGGSSDGPSFKVILKEAKAIPGLIPLHRKEDRLYAELSGDHYKSEYIVLITIARGIGQDPLYGGMTWGFGDDWVWTFRKVEDRVHIIRKNVRFKADPGTPAASSVEFAYTDSVLFSLPIVTKGPKGGDLVDLTPVFMSDLPQISLVLPGFAFSPSKSTWDEAKGFRDNVELQVAATYASGGMLEIDSVPDSRGVTIGVHYSISKIPSNGYKPRVADDRVGYFLTVRKDYSKGDDNEDRFVRFINRWDLRKADDSAELSPPEKSIIFYLENTVPYKYRKTVREGIEEWNKAFEKAGFANAIEVRQQRETDTWDPEDINYNTFRWITSSAGFAMGPSRVNPYTGQILDADIIFDADFLTYWSNEFETFTPASIASMTGGALDLESYQRELAKKRPRDPAGALQRCQRQQTMALQFAFGTAAATVMMDPKVAAEHKEKLILQGLKGTVMHEVGHTLGLRHNFKGSTYLSLEDINNPKKSQETGMLSSVMDYDAVNIVPKDEKQGDYYTTTIGPYDMWAIEYGYQEISGNQDEELKKIASRSGEPGLDYATDEDTRGIDPDPYTNRYDLGNDPFAFAQRQTTLVRQLLPDVIDRMTEDGEDYSKARRAFNVLLAAHGQSMFFVARMVGGLQLTRSHKGDKDAREPVVLVDPDQQRKALKMLEENVFANHPAMVDPELYNKLASSRWSHWGQQPTTRPDYPVHDIVLMWQQRVLDQLLSSRTLQRISDSEMKVGKESESLTGAELIQRLTAIIFSEVSKDELKGEFSDRNPAVASVRRNLQRDYLQRLGWLAMGETAAPPDCQTVAFYELKELEKKMRKTLESTPNLDLYTKAHLEETASRIEKIIDAKLNLSSP